LSSLPRPSGPVAWTAGVALLSVLYMALVVPLGFGPDETQHAFRAYQLALGNLFPQLVNCVAHPHLASCRPPLHARLVPHRRAGGALPYGLVHVFDYLYRREHKPSGGPTRFGPRAYATLAGASLGGRTTFAHFENTALYSPANYIPQIVVFWIARLVGAPALATMFAARLVGGLVWAALVSAAVAIVPRWKWLLSLAVLVPTALAQGSDISADSLTLGVVALTTAYALALADRGGVLRRREVAALALLGLVIGLMKFPLLLILAALLALVWRALGGGRGRWLRAAAIAAPGVLAGVWWDLAADSYFVPYRDVVYRVGQRIAISEPRQLHHLISEPYVMASIVWNTLAHGHLLYIDEVVGQVGQNSLPGALGIVWLAVFALLALASGEGGGPPGRVRAWIGGTLLAYLLATAVALYVTWSAVGASQISGMHGRYLTLVLVLALPLLAGAGARRFTLGPRTTRWAAVALSAVSAGWLYAYTSVHYYDAAPWTAVARVGSVLF